MQSKEGEEGVGEGACASVYETDREIERSMLKKKGGERERGVL